MTARRHPKNSGAFSKGPKRFCEITTEDELMRHAMVTARIIMGREEPRAGRGWTRKSREWKAEQDPLAWWCLVELLMGYARAGSRLKLAADGGIRDG